MSSGEKFFLTEGQLEELMASPQQMHRVMKNGEWARIVINKAHIVSIKESEESMELRRLNQTNENTRRQLEGAKPTSSVLPSEFVSLLPTEHSASKQSSASYREW